MLHTKFQSLSINIDRFFQLSFGERQKGRIRLGALPKLKVELGEGVVQWKGGGGITRKLSILSLMILEESSKTKDFSPDMFRYFYH